MEKIQPKPAKLWERTNHLTVEDVTLYGGLLGIATVLHRRAVPGAHGFSRFFGAAMVGCGLGCMIGKDLLRDPHSELIGEHTMILDRMALRSYKMLKQNTEAQASLSRIGKLALEYHTSPHIQILKPAVDDISGMFAQRFNGQREELPEQKSSISIIFSEGELDGPDIDGGYREYMDKIQSRDESSVQGRLGHIQNLKTRLKAEHQLVWKLLLKKEDEFYGHLVDDQENSVLRRELQMLNNMCLDLYLRCAILSYQEKDAQKQIHQMEPAGIHSHTTIAPQDPAEVAFQNHDTPHYVTKRLRTACSQERKLLSRLDELISILQSGSPEQDPQLRERLSVRKRHAERLREDLVAKERLLKWYEEQVHKSEEQGPK